jgi:hypothetical protein
LVLNLTDDGAEVPAGRIVWSGIVQPTLVFGVQFYEAWRWQVERKWIDERLRT